VSSGAVARPAGRPVAVRVGGVLLAAAALAAWVLTMQAAARTLSFEPNSTQAIETSAAARTPALVWGLLLLAAAVALALVSGHRWLALLGGPGLVVAAFVLVVPGSNGGSLLSGLAASLLVGGVTLYLEARHLRARRRSATHSRPH
jgi:hypothetical protein